MATQQKIDEVANLWNKTRDPKYKEESHKLIREWADGINNTNRRNVSSSTSDRRDVIKSKTV